MKHLILAVLLVLNAVPALAHSKADKMDPANGAILSAMPEVVSLTFVKKIRLTKVRMTHSEQISEDLDLGDQKAFLKKFSVPTKDLGRGTYVIEWRGLSADGHAMKGDFSFEVE